MQEELKQLLQLCDLDKKIFDLRKSNKNLPIKIAALKEEIGSAQNKLNKLVTDMEECEKKISDAKNFAEEEKKNLENSNHRLENITTNKEYDAIHAEIATHKKKHRRVTGQHFAFSANI